MLLDWINDVLADDRIIVKDIEEDLFDGQILQKLIGMSGDTVLALLVLSSILQLPWLSLLVVW